MKYPTELTGQEIAGIYIHEPSAMLSNIAIVVTCSILVIKHRSAIGQGKNWRSFILCLGLAASGGSLTHGLPTYLGPELYFLVWWVKNSFVLIANYFATLAIFSFTDLPNKTVKWAALAKASIGIILLYATFNFLPAAIDLAITYVSILVITWKRSDHETSRLLKIGFLIALFSGVFYLIPFSTLHGWFTNKDAVHVFAILSLVYISGAISSLENE